MGEDNKALVDSLHFGQKVERAENLIREYFDKFGDGAVVANSLGKDSMVVWDMAVRINPNARGFIITTPFKPQQTIDYMHWITKEYPNLQVFQSDRPREDIYKTDPDRCCGIYKVEPVKRAVVEMDVKCWITGLRCTEGRTRTDYKEVEYRDKDLVKLNPILLFKEREIWQYLALHGVKVNPLYGLGLRSLGCAPCTSITASDNERDGRWVGTSKCGGECGIHTRPLKEDTAPTI